MFLYEQYANRQEAAAQRAIRDAAEEQAALDQDALNRWQAGEMSDAEWVAYLKGRIAATTDDAEQQTALKELLRDSQEQIAVRRVEQGAADLMNRIEDGTASWSDLRNFFVRERARQPEGSEMYRQLTEQIDGVNDTIRDNATNSAIGEAQYLFQSGQISGAEAARRIRAAAERYRTSDPGKYWDLVSSAYDMQTYGTGGPRGSGGRGGGGLTEKQQLNNTIDALEYTADSIDLLNDQFKNGKRVGELPDGTQVVLADENGNPAGVWREIDQMMLETLDAKYEAQIANGDRSAVETMQRKEAYLSAVVQPRNTIPKEKQFGALTRDLGRAIELAEVDPTLGAKAIADVLGSMDRWVSRLNTMTTSTDVEKRADDAKVRENPELAAAVRRQTTTAAPEIRQVDGDFVGMARAFVDAARQAYTTPGMTADQINKLMEPFGGEGALVDAATADRLLVGVQAVSTMAVGLQTGEWVKVWNPATGAFEVAKMTQRSWSPDGGQPVTVAHPDIDVAQSQEAVMMLAEVDGKIEPIWAVGDYVAGQPYADENGKTVIPRQLELTGPNGEKFARDEAGAWSTDDGVGAVLPFFGASRSNAQRWVNANPETAARLVASHGGDPADIGNLFYRSDRLITAREDETQRDYNFMQQQSRRPAGSPVNVKPRLPAQPEFGTALGQSRNYLQGAGVTFPIPERQSEGNRGYFTPQVQEIGRGLGIRFQVENNRTTPQIRMPEIRQVNVPQLARSVFDPSALHAQMNAMKQRLQSNLTSLPGRRSVRFGDAARNLRPVLE